MLNIFLPSMSWADFPVLCVDPLVPVPDEKTLTDTVN